MYQHRAITEDLYWIGGNDRRLALFENVYPIPRGVSYNAYLLMDEKTVLLDTVDKSVSDVFLENLGHLLGERRLDYVIVNHMEPDHCAALGQVLHRYPEAVVVCTQKALDMIGQFFGAFPALRSQTVKEGDTLTTGRHTLSFVMAPMVHWPEVMVTYDAADKILFSADAFGTFGALGGNLFADEIPFEGQWLEDARRYYTNIVGKYGPQVQALLKKAASLEIQMLCPLHGPIWRENIGWFLDKYMHWSSYTPEESAVMIAYGSVYGNTEAAAFLLASRLAERSVRNVLLYDVSVTHPSLLVAEAFRCSHLIFASATYNAGIFPCMETLLLELKAHSLKNRTVGLLDNGTWAATAGNQMRTVLESMQNMTILEPVIHIKSALTEAQLPELDALADAVAASL